MKRGRSKPKKSPQAGKDKPRQYTIRAIPPEVDRALREQARREGKSLNEVAVEALSRGAGMVNGAVKFRDLDHLIGTWKEDPEFDKAIAEMRQIEPELWR